MTATRAGTAHQVWSQPQRILTSAWPLRALAYVVSSAVVGLVTLIWLPVAFVLGAVVLTPWLVRPLVSLERRRVALLGHGPIPDPHLPPAQPGMAAWLRSRYSEATTWRELAYTALHGTVLLVLDVAATAIVFAPLLILGGIRLVVPGPRPDALDASWTADGTDVIVLVLLAVLAGLTLLVVAFVVIVYAVPLIAVAHSELARILLSAGPEETVRTLTQSRARLVNAFEVERRRIERDLHDGAQQRLLELGMTLVSAQLELDDDPEAARPLLQHAAGQARSALAELRELIRGIHPQVLTDLGLPPAVAELADRSSVPVKVSLDLPDRLPAAVEATAYFVIAEALANAARHAQATRISITGTVAGKALRITVRDDGVGGADPDKGTGLAGLADRVDALDGTLTLSSPRGGPTTLFLDLPCSE